MNRGAGDNYLTAGHYGVLDWHSASGAVASAACHDNGRWSVADPRSAAPDALLAAAAHPMPAADDKLVAVIRSQDGTWHRPITTLEMAALQSLYDPDDFVEGQPFVLGGSSDTTHREWIGNMVPPEAAEAIANEIGRTLLLAWSGETFQLSSTPIWVRQIAIGLSVKQEGR